MCDRDFVSDNVVFSVYRPILAVGIYGEGLGFRRLIMWYGELLPTPQPQTGETRWPTAQNVLYAALISSLPRDLNPDTLPESN
jgi:hypothetical protein